MKRTNLPSTIPTWKRVQGEWQEDIPAMAYQMALLGHDDGDMARVLHVTIERFRRWRSQRPELQRAIWQGQDEADARVAESLYRCAIGYEYEEDYVSSFKGDIQIVRVKRYQKPDPEAARKWLSARHKDKWNDRAQADSAQTTVNIHNSSIAVLTTEELLLAKKLGFQQMIEPQTDN